MALTGAAITLVAIFLPWASIDLPPIFEDIDIPLDTSFNGLNLSAGFLSLIVAIAAVPLGILALVLKGGGTRRGMGIALVSTGAALLLLVIIGFISAMDAVLQIGAFLALGASPLVAVGGILAIIESGRLPAMARLGTPVPPPPQPTP